MTFAGGVMPWMVLLALGLAACRGSSPPTPLAAKGRSAMAPRVCPATPPSPFGITSADPPTWPCACGEEVACAERCERGSARDCAQAGACYGGMSSWAPDAARFARYSERGCEGGEVLGCVNAGKAYAAGFGVSKDPRAAGRFFARAVVRQRADCADDIADGCSQLAYALEHGEGVPRDPELAATVRGRACELGSVIACLLVAAKAKDREDAETAGGALVRACELGCVACEQVGEAAKNGGSTAALAVATWRARCARAEPAACSICALAGC